METKHTKGKWECKFNNFFWEVRGAGNILSPYINIHSMTRDEAPSLKDEDVCTPEEAEANAKLIAAAPDLLAALILISEGCDELKSNGFSSLTAIKSIADRAITKATK